MLVNLLFFLALQIVQSLALILPSQDSFYSTPHNVSDYKSGQVIHVRNVRDPVPSPGNFTTRFKSANQYLYRTTDSLGKPVAAVTTLLVPFQANATQLLSYQFAYDSSDIDCSPSYTLFSGGTDISGTEHAFASIACACNTAAF